MMIRIRLAVVAATTILLVAPATIATAHQPVPGRTSIPPAAEAQILSRDLRIRAEFGLSLHQSSIQAASNGYGTSTDLLGIPLTPAERADIAHRDLLIPMIDRLNQRLINNNVFAGLWIDQHKGGVLHFAQTSGDLSPVVESYITPDHPVVYETFANSLSQLNSTEAAVTAAVLSHHGEARYINSSSVSVPDNAVVLVLKNDAPAGTDQALNRTYGAKRISIRRGVSEARPASNRDIRTGPLYGGEYIYNKNSNGSCTAGFSDATSGGNYFTITAGHCGNGVWYRGYQNTQYGIGSAHSNHFIVNGSSKCDCVAVGPISSSIRTASVLVVNNGTNHYVGTASSYPTGARVCLSGATSAGKGSDINCGEIKSSGGTIGEGDGYTLVDPVATSIQGFPGDSGGPVGNNATQLIGLYASTSYYMPSGAFYQSYLSKGVNIGPTVGVSLVY